MTYKQVTTEWKVGRNTMLTLIHDDMFPEQLRVLVGAYDVMDSATAQSHTLVMDKSILEELLRSLYEAAYHLDIAIAARMKAEDQALEQSEEDALAPAVMMDADRGDGTVGLTEADPF